MENLEAQSNKHFSTKTKLVTPFECEIARIARIRNPFPQKRHPTDKTRMICLTKTKINFTNIKIREDLMSDAFPSIWLEATNVL